jgi:hypothetical protein
MLSYCVIQKFIVLPKRVNILSKEGQSPLQQLHGEAYQKDINCDRMGYKLLYSYGKYV